MYSNEILESKVSLAKEKKEKRHVYLINSQENYLSDKDKEKTINDLSILGRKLEARAPRLLVIHNVYKSKINKIHNRYFFLKINIITYS